MYHTHQYVIDWDKVQTLEDMKRVLAASYIQLFTDDKKLDSIQGFIRIEQKPPLIATMD